jgi:hypothetical protein
VKYPIETGIDSGNATRLSRPARMADAIRAGDQPGASASTQRASASGFSRRTQPWLKARRGRRKERVVRRVVQVDVERIRELELHEAERIPRARALPERDVPHVAAEVHARRIHDLIPAQDLEVLPAQGLPDRGAPRASSRRARCSWARSSTG